MQHGGFSRLSNMNDQTLKVIASNVNTTWNQEPEGEEWKKKGAVEGRSEFWS